MGWESPLGRQLQINQWATAPTASPPIIFPHQQVLFWSLLGQGMPLSSPESTGTSRELGLVPHSPEHFHPEHLQVTPTLPPEQLIILSQFHSLVQALATSPGTVTLFSWLQALGCLHHIFSLLCLLIFTAVSTLGLQVSWRVPTAFRIGSNTQILW